MKETSGLWIPNDVMQDDNLSLNDKLVISVLISLDRKSGCTASNEYILECLPKMSDKTLRRSLVYLESKNYIDIQNKQSRYRVIKVLPYQSRISTRSKSARLLGQNRHFNLAKTGTSTRSNEDILLGQNSRFTRSNEDILLGQNSRFTRSNEDNLPIILDNNIKQYIIQDDVGEKYRAEPLVFVAQKATSPPTLEEIEKYAKETDSAVNARRFYDYHVQRDWKGITDWKSRFDAWGQNEIGKAEKAKSETKCAEKPIIDLDLFDEVETAMGSKE